MDGLTLTDGKVIIRPYQLDDIDRLAEAAVESVNTIYPWLPWCHPAYSRTDAETWVNSRPVAWNEGAAFAFVITYAETGRFIGGIGLNHVIDEYKMANLGYWVRRMAMGHGHAPAATRLVARFGFERLDLNRIEVIAAVGNRPSQRAEA